MFGILDAINWLSENNHVERYKHSSKRQCFWFESSSRREARTKRQSQLNDLLARNSEDKLSKQESQQLDCLIEQIDELNLLKARADFTLRHQKNADD